MTMTVSRYGTFKTDFVDEDVSGNLAEYYRDWERKYLFHDRQSITCERISQQLLNV